MPVFSAQSLTDGIDRIFQACGVSAPEARVVADHLVDAECCGVVSHGVIRVPQYVQSIRDRRVNLRAHLQLVRETPATAAFDGKRGFGQVMALRAMDEAIARARHGGVAAVTLTNCGHTGRLAHYTAHAAAQGLVGIMLVNSGGAGQWVAPYGGMAGRLATNPLSIAVPCDEQPLVLDMATSSVPEGRIRALLTAGRTIPTGWIIDAAGQPTTSPGDLYGPPRGAILPFGGHKGFGLSMIVDVLAGILSGAGCCTSIEAPLAGETDGVCLLALDVTAFCPLEVFREMVGRLVRHVKSSPPAAGVAEVFAPGEIESRTRSERLASGVPIDAATWRLVAETAIDVGVDVVQAFDNPA